MEDIENIIGKGNLIIIFELVYVFETLLIRYLQFQIDDENSSV